MTKQEILSYVGDIAQAAYIIPYQYLFGPESGSKSCEINNGKICMTVLLDKGMDIYNLSHQSDNISFLTKNGNHSPYLCHTDAFRFENCFNAGFLYTCGPDNTGGARNHTVTHGTQNSTPASNISFYTGWEGDDYILRLSGTIKNTALFKQNLEVIRTIATKYGSDEFEISDTLINRGFHSEEYVYLYHFNIGYPMLQQGAFLDGDFLKTEPRDEEAAKGVDVYNLMEAPAPDYDEQVFFHTMKKGDVGIELKNKILNKKLRISFNSEKLPYALEWKSMRSGDYALGIEPATSTITDKFKKSIILPQEEIIFKFKITFQQTEEL